jgi:hypothetical protein
VNVVVEDFVEEDDELYEVGIRLLPERFFPLAKHVVEERRNAIRERIGVEFVMEWVVPPRAVEAHLEIVPFPPVRRENPTDLMTEVPLTSRTTAQKFVTPSPRRCKCPED